VLRGFKYPFRRKDYPISRHREFGRKRLRSHWTFRLLHLAMGRNWMNSRLFSLISGNLDWRRVRI
jgi:hypothetical protein